MTQLPGPLATFDWAALERMWLERIERAVLAFGKKHPEKRAPTGAWAARAFGAPADRRSREARAGESTRENAVEGLKHARPASYPELAALLASGDTETEKLIANALAPGSAAMDLVPAHFDVLAAHAQSPHAAIRADVACALGDDALGADNQARAVPILVAMLGDRRSEVRRLAALGLESCARCARSAEAALRVAEGDRVKAVAAAATRARAAIRKS